MEQDYIAKTALDEMVESDRDQMLKAMVPYLPPSGQQFLSMYTKTQELMNTMSLFPKPEKICGSAGCQSFKHRSSGNAAGYPKMLQWGKPPSD